VEHVTIEPSANRTAIWLPLLQGLTEASPGWLVWKNAESALTGTGDIDAAADETDWPVIEAEVRRWAVEQDVGPVVVCHHIPGGLNLIAVARHLPTFLEMGVKARRIWRGSTLFVHAELLPMAALDPRGFRRLRPGAEGLFKLLLNGTRRDCGPNVDGLREKHVRELLRSDPDGVRQAARLLGPAERAVLVGARRAAAGGWDRRAMVTVQAWMLLRALRRPRILLDRVRFRLHGRYACPVVDAILQGGRRIPGDPDVWLARVAVDHVVYAE
jgi:hypothetical protein